MMDNEDMKRSGPKAGMAPDRRWKSKSELLADDLARDMAKEFGGKMHEVKGEKNTYEIG